MRPPLPTFRACRSFSLCVGLAAAFAVLGGDDSPSPTFAGGGDEPIVNSVGMRFVPIPKGTFRMGAGDAEEGRRDDETLREVVLTKPFYLGVYEVTQRQFEAVLGANPSYFTHDGPAKIKLKTKSTAEYPVDEVTWDQAVAFCRKLSAAADETVRGFSYRLPTEAEWEYACRAGTSAATHFGDDFTAFDANFNGVMPLGKGRTGPFLRTPWTVGAYKANAFGLYDMHGNVAEWCADWYAPDYALRAPKADPTGPLIGTERVVRGGGWPHPGRSCRSATRGKLAPDQASYSVGFRVVLVVAPR